MKTPIQKAIQNRGKLLKQYRAAVKREKFVQKTTGCPDDQTIYDVFTAWARYLESKNAVRLVKEAKEFYGRRK